MLFDVKTLKMEIDESGDKPQIVIHQEDLYPPIIARIVEVLDSNEPPLELVALPEKGGWARAETLLKTARELPAEAWEDALKPRDEFHEVSYQSVVDRNGKVNTTMLNMLKAEDRKAVERLVNRGFALEVALGWFSQALRLRVGGYRLRITKGEKGENGFRL